MTTIHTIDAAFTRLNTILDAAGALEAEATQRAVYQLRLEIVRALGDSDRIQAAELSLAELAAAEPNGDASDIAPLNTIGSNVSTFWDDVLDVGILVHPADGPAAQQVIAILLEAQERIGSLTDAELDQIAEKCSTLIDGE
jgi:hypothetical protein